VLNPDNPGEAFLQVDPDQRGIELEVAMMLKAETQYAVTQADGRQRLTVWCPAGDSLRQDILTRRGYIRQAGGEYQRRRLNTQAVPEVPLAQGYTIRPVGGEEDMPARSWVSWKAFHPDEPDECYQGWEWYQNVRKAPLYRPELDLVAVTSSGEHAAFCTLWCDEKTHSAAFEPVGTHPEHQRRGLAKALMAEGLRRVHELGATLVTVGSYSNAAGALYASMGFAEYDLSEPWEKIW
jgi:ribosomal protein S18 acetylase RimI-like enzyme